MARSRTAEQAARVRQLETSLSRNEIRAPFDGRVAERFADAGAVVGPGTPVVRLISAGDLLVRAAVPPEEARRLKAGDPVTVDRPHAGAQDPGHDPADRPRGGRRLADGADRGAPRPHPRDESRLQTGLVVDVAPRQG